jgi:hypothetical protein
MKHTIAIAGLFAAAALLTPAEASTVLFNTSSLTNGNYSNPYSISLSNSGGTIAAYGYEGVFTAQNPPSTVSVTGNNADDPVSSSAPGIAVSNAGLGVNNGGNPENPDIAPGDAVVLDFSGVSSTVKQNVTNVAFTATIDVNGPSYWVVYGYNATAKDYTLLTDGPMEQPTTGKNGNGLTGTYTGTAVSFQTSSLYSEYLVGITNDCDLTINSVTITYNGQTTQQTPEPGTFVMAGMALLAIGVTMKKRSRKA